MRLQCRAMILCAFAGWLGLVGAVTAEATGWAVGTVPYEILRRLVPAGSNAISGGLLKAAVAGLPAVWWGAFSRWNQ